MFAAEPIPASIPAAVLRGPQDLVLERIPQWSLESYGDEDLMLIEVGACGVCGSDYRYFAGENPWAQHTLGRFVPNPPNIVLGHEYAGRVVKVGSKENENWLGKRVAPICSKVCGVCEECCAGRAHLCPNTVHMGHGQGWGERDFFPGAYAPYTLAWGAECFEIPDHVTYQEAAMMDILAVCVHAANTAGDFRGRDILVIGSGPAGNGIAQACLLKGASKAVLLDRSPIALDVGRRQAFGTVVDSPNGLQKGFGAIFDTVGTPETFQLGLDLLGNRGTLVNLAIHDQPMTLNLMNLGSERRITTSCNFERKDFEEALEALADGRFQVREWQTLVAVRELPNLFRRALNEPNHIAFKLVVDPGLSGWTEGLLTPR